MMLCLEKHSFNVDTDSSDLSVSAAAAAAASSWRHGEDSRTTHEDARGGLKDRVGHRPQSRCWLGEAFLGAWLSVCVSETPLETENHYLQNHL